MGLLTAPSRMGLRSPSCVVCWVRLWLSPGEVGRLDLAGLGSNTLRLEVRRRGVFQGWSCCCAVGEWRGRLPKGSCTFRGSDKDPGALWPALWQSGGAIGTLSIPLLPGCRESSPSKLVDLQALALSTPIAITGGGNPILHG